MDSSHNKGGGSSGAATTIATLSRPLRRSSPCGTLSDRRGANVLTIPPHIIEEYNLGSDKGEFPLRNSDLRLAYAQSNLVLCDQEDRAEEVNLWCLPMLS